MNVKKGYMKVGDDTVLPFTSYDCIIDKDGNKLTESAESITQNTNAVANIGDYIGVDVSKKRNLFDGQLEMGSITGTGEELSISSRVRAKGYVEVEVGKTYAVSLQGLDYFGVAIYTSSFGFVSDNSWIASGSTFTVTATSSKYARIYFRKADNSDLSIAEDYKIMLVEGTSPSAYIPYRKLITDEDVLTAEEISASTSLKSTDVASAETVKSRYVNIGSVSAPNEDISEKAISLSESPFKYKFVKISVAYYANGTAEFGSILLPTESLHGIFEYKFFPCRNGTETGWCSVTSVTDNSITVKRMSITDGNYFCVFGVN